MLGEKQLDGSALPEGVDEWRTTLGKLPRHGAIMHLFIGLDAEGLDLSHIQARDRPLSPPPPEHDHAFHRATQTPVLTPRASPPLCAQDPAH